MFNLLYISLVDTSSSLLLMAMLGWFQLLHAFYMTDSKLDLYGDISCTATDVNFLICMLSACNLHAYYITGNKCSSWNSLADWNGFQIQCWEKAEIETSQSDLEWNVFVQSMRNDV